MAASIRERAYTHDYTENFTHAPHHPVSVEALVYIGFTRQAATKISHRWLTFNTVASIDIDAGAEELFTFAIGHINKIRKDAWGPDDQNWFVTMTEYGLNQEFQEAIMASKFKQVRMLHSCQEWVIDTLDARYTGLIKIHQASLEHSSTSGGYGQPGPATFVSYLTAPFYFNNPHYHVQPKVPGMQVLWKGVIADRIEQVFAYDGTVHDFARMTRDINEDFNSENRAYYFSKDLSVAEASAGYLKCRAPHCQVVLLRMEIPADKMDDLPYPQKLQIWSDMDEFKQLVWNCRRGHTLRTELQKYDDATLIIGNICTLPNNEIRSMQNFDEISGAGIMKTTNDESAVQYAFIGSRGASFLEQYARTSCGVFAVHNYQEMRLLD